ncbi:MAG: hemerythrin domain-containing protein [Planctomycetota bacterium]
MEPTPTRASSKDLDWHPVDPLIAEHDVILGVLAAAERRLVAERDRGTAYDATYWLDLARFLHGFADELHHAKEEAHLFPALTRCGLPEQGGPVAVMKQEHEQGRALVRGFRAAAKADDQADTWRQVGLFVELLRQHIAKENQVLFEMARRLLPEPEVTGLRWTYEELAAATDDARTRKELLALAADLDRRA